MCEMHFIQLSLILRLLFGDLSEKFVSLQVENYRLKAPLGDFMP